MDEAEGMLVSLYQNFVSQSSTLEVRDHKKGDGFKSDSQYLPAISAQKE
jgi:hypothetical protein